MVTAYQNSSPLKNSVAPVRPSKVNPLTARPFTLDQELKPFGRWVDGPIWVPPKDSSKEMAESMLANSGLLSSRSKSWARVVDEHRDNFTQVREIELDKASIRLPKGRLYVTVTEQKHFDRITDQVPNCVQTRLEEFLAGPGKKPGVKIYYLKPLCVEVDDVLYFTGKDEVFAAIEKIQNEVFSEYCRRYLAHTAKRAMSSFVSASLAIPRSMSTYFAKRRKRAIDAFEARLEFKRRQTALDAVKSYRKCRTSECTFNDMLDMTTPLEREAVVRQYSIQQELSRAQQLAYMQAAADQLPWFASLAASITGYIGFSGIAGITLTYGPPLFVCDPAFVAEMPGSEGVVLNIGHFDEIAGVRHIEM